MPGLCIWRWVKFWYKKIVQAYGNTTEDDVGEMSGGEMIAELAQELKGLKEEAAEKEKEEEEQPRKPPKIRVPLFPL